ncbi:hypothetical protein L6R53_32750 [Myxococcota bacterium]|nr:hypothetical protein [Myxococcota bacterium]
MVLLLLLLACEAPVLPVRETLAARVPWTRVVAVELAPVQVAEGVARPDETAALLTALLERRLADLEGVLPEVAGVEPRPGLAGTVAPAARWRLQVQVDGRGDELSVRLSLCEGPSCDGHEVTGSRLQPTALAAQVATWVGESLDREPLSDPSAWAAPESADDYAVLISGRAAGVVYGLRPPPALEDLGHNQRDPLARATFLDPAMPTAWYLRARSPLSGSLAARRLMADRAAALDPSDPVLLADAAALALAAGEAAAALRGFEAVRGAAPDDLRFALPLAEAGLAAGAPEVTRRQVDRLRSVDAARADRLSLEVRLAEATGSLRPDELERLLLAWQVAAPQDPEPVQRRVDLRVAQQDLAGALALIPELRLRAPGAGTQAQELALAAAVGAWEQAGAAATGLGDPRLAADMQALARRADPAAAAALIEGAPEPPRRLARARLLLDAGAPEQALVEALAVQAQAPWDPDALAACVASWRARGHEPEALACARDLARVDPLHPLALLPRRVGP